MCGDCMPQFHVRVCETKISICNQWELEEFKTTCKLVFNRFWKPSVSSLYFLYKPNLRTRLHLIVSRSEQKENISTLKYAFLIQIGLIMFLFLPFKLFISSWSLWSNSTHPDESSWEENSKVCRHTQYSNWIQLKRGIKYKCSNVESQKRAILYTAWLDEKLNLHEMIKILTAFWKT